MHVSDIRQQLRALGAKPRHEERVLRLWAQALPQTSGKRPLDSFLPRALREALPALSARLAGLARLHSTHPASDGSARLLVAMADGQTVESVLLPAAESAVASAAASAVENAVENAVDNAVENRAESTVDRSSTKPGRRTAGHSQGLCVSTQIGCAVGCVFCMTGKSGLLRQLGSAEIVAQVVLARGLRPVHKVVFMGMGEPAHNLDAVLDAIDLLGTGGGIGHKNLVLSTVGDARVFERLLGPGSSTVKPALALSLHTTHAGLRAQLLPRAPRLSPRELVEAGERYARATGYPIQYQWTLIDGVNDGDDEIDGIVDLLSGKYALMNLIPYNAVDGLHFQRPSWERAAQMARSLHRRGILTKLRQSAGQDVDAGCGQLRARHIPISALPPAAPPPPDAVPTLQ